jgi:two-component system CheB/CheR fusion protein
MSLLHGVLYLLEPAAPRGLRLPIDFFLRSLAQDQQERSIGVILSGMGSDGTLGLRSIKEKAGLVLVQEPATAKFDGMPRSAIDAGLADIVAPASELPLKIINYLQHAPLSTGRDLALEDKTQSAMEKAIILLRSHTGHDFSPYKRNTLYRRIERRMGIHQIDKIALYVRYLQENTQELDLLFKELLIGVTSFFRDPLAWEQLRDHAFPALITSRAPGQALRAWVPGCSSGEEAYSLAIVFKEALELIKPKGSFTLQLFATDLDRDAVEKARQGLFPENITADVSAERLSRFFVKEERGYRVRKEIREMVVFAPQNLLQDPPFTRLDILSCRNLLIYLTQEMQKKLFPLLHFSLNPGGILFLGSAESIGGFTDLFRPLGDRARIYRRSLSALPSEPVEFPSSFTRPLPAGSVDRVAQKPPPSFQSLADQLVLRRYSLPSVLVNDKGDILYVSGKTGRYLEPAAGKANWNIFAMARQEVRHELAGAFQKALRQNCVVTLGGLNVGTPNGEQSLRLTVEPLDESEPLRGLIMIVFAEQAPPLKARGKGRLRNASAPGASRLTDLERELDQALQELQTTRQEMQTAQEVLKSTNEELQSANEELQSTNEELTTSKEEMQSMNEELQTVNTELQAKVDDLSRANTDMKNLLNSTDIATVFLDNDLHVRRFTDRATHIFKLIPGDVGRPITDLDSHLRYPELAEDAREVLRTLAPAEKPIATRDGRWFTVRIMPYRTLDDRIDGLVLTFADISAAKSLEAKFRAAQADLEKRVGDQAAQLARRR